MKNIIRICCIALFVFVASCQGKAQQEQLTKESLKNSTPQQRAKFLTDTMHSVLNLSNEQYTSVYNINLDIAKKNEAVFKSDDGKMSKFKQIKANQELRDSALKKVLTEQQFNLYHQKIDDIINAIRQKQ